MAKANSQSGLFGSAEWWEEIWRGMPEFIQEDLAPIHSIQLDFKDQASVKEFEKLVRQKIPGHEKRTPSIWFPEAEIGSFAGKSYRAKPPKQPRFPVYVISKGRWESKLTSKSLHRMGVEHFVVVEPQEREAYARSLDSSATILALPFSNLGLGSIPARNFCWEHSVEALGTNRHWILDDNIDGFFRLNKNLKTPVGDGTIFFAAEEFVERFENVAIAGFHYFMFASRKTKLPPFTLNSRVYSMILIRNDLRLGVDGVGQWRGRYNEDTDLSLRALKAGMCTVLFTAFLGLKQTTMTMKGGNSDQLYAGTEAAFKTWVEHARPCEMCKYDEETGQSRFWNDRQEVCAVARDLLGGDGRWLMAMSLWGQHPDVTKIVRKWGRWQHDVDYSRITRLGQNRLVPKAGLALPDGVDDFGMTLHIDHERTRAAA